MDAGHHTHGQIHGYDGAAAVAHKGKGQADDRHQAQTHTHIDADLKDQCRRNAHADQAAHIVRRLNRHINHPEGNRRQQKQGEGTSQHPQFLTDGGEDEVRMLGVQSADLGSGAVVQALARQTAAGEGQKTVLHMPPLIQALGVDGGVENDENPVFLIVCHHIGPDIWHHRGNAAEAAQKPPQLYAAGKGHGQKNENENQGNAGVTGKDHVQAHQEDQMEAHGNDRSGRGDPVSVDLHDLGQQDSKGNFTNLSRLDVDRKSRQVQPAPVSGAAGGAEGDQQQKKGGVENK